MLRESGLIWLRSPWIRAYLVGQVCEALEEYYGRLRLGNPEEPVDDLVFVILSNKTAPEIAKRVYSSLRNRFSSWDDLLAAPMKDLYALLQPAGLATVKTQQIRAALERIENDFGSFNLEGLKRKPQDEIESYLVSLPGVSEKVAKCVMMYTMGVDVLPVDAHVHRIARRLGWTSRKRADQCHGELEALVPPSRRFAFHVDCILHGRSMCRPRNPACDLCCITRYCSFFGAEVRDDDRG